MGIIKRYPDSYSMPSDDVLIGILASISLVVCFLVIDAVLPLSGM